ncbi:MAG: hypothetical protein ABFD64_10625 [Armatimonadota bacterium]
MKIISRGNSQKVASIELEGLLLVYSTKTIKLQTQDGTSRTAVVVVGDGHTRRWVYVIAINTDTGTLKPILDEWHEGDDVGYHFNKSGQLERLTLRYASNHVAGDAFPGHLRLERDFIWSASKQGFIESKLRPNVEGEAKLTLAETLYMAGQDPTLGTNGWYSDKSTHADIFVFEPKGLLRSKIPPDMRWAKKFMAKTRIVLVTEKECYKKEEFQLIELRGLNK